MRDEEDGGAGLAPEAKQLVAHEQPGLLVERAEGLVEEKQARARDEGAGDADPLPHAAGELRRIRPRKGHQPHERQRMLNPLADVRLGQPGPAQREGGVVERREPRKARVLLEHDADAVRHTSGDGTPFEGHRTRGWARKPGDDVEKRRLSAAGGPDHGKELALTQLEAEGAERMDRLLPLAWGIEAGHAVKADLDAVAPHRRPPVPAPVMPDATRRPPGACRCGACRPIPPPRFAAAR